MQLTRRMVLVSIPFKRESPFGPDSAVESNTTVTVSIPFKRESPFGLWSQRMWSVRNKVSIPFKRESPFGLVWELSIVSYNNWVSIPFKRESPFGPLCWTSCWQSTRSTFQFPSNGKTLSDTGDISSAKKVKVKVNRVSIPFKRESPFGQKFHAHRSHYTFFVSIPFKRESPFGLQSVEQTRFRDFWVSIPFKRESPFGRNSRRPINCKNP